MPEATGAPYVFISYATHDGTTDAEKLAAALRACGCSVFLAGDSIPPGSSFVPHIDASINRASHMVVILTPGSNQSEWVHREVLAFESRTGRKIIPAYCKLISQMSLIFHGRNYTEFFNAATYNSAFTKILQALDWECQPGSDWKQLPFIDLGLHVDQSRLVCGKRDITVAQAYELMRLHDFKFRHIPITHTGEAGGKLLGIVSLRQITKYLRTGMDVNIPVLPEDPSIRSIANTYHDNRTLEPEALFNYLCDGDSTEIMLQRFMHWMTPELGCGRVFRMSALPIITAERETIGIMSFKDLCRGILKGYLPLPANLRVEEITNTVDKTYTDSRQLKVSKPGDTVAAIQLELSANGQRDSFIVDTNNRLLGIIPDQILIKMLPRPPEEKIRVSFTHLKQQTPETPVVEVLESDPDESKQYYYFPVVERIEASVPPAFLGGMSYREIIEILLRS